MLVQISCVTARKRPEGRQSFRVSCVVDELTISFGGSADCSLVDVSSTGFGVVSSEEYEIGATVTATPTYEECGHTGNVRIQSAVELRKGGFRYGVRCVDSDLQDVVRQISMAVQHSQLRRLAAQG
jgi:hypothetical protein